MRPNPVAEFFRKIRDEQEPVSAGKSPAEIIALSRKQRAVAAAVAAIRASSSHLKPTAPGR